jgi:hypothetical protein
VFNLLAFVVLTKTFDPVDRKAFFIVLRKAGCPPIPLKLIREFHSGVQGYIKIDGELSGPLEIKRGVKRGCMLAPSSSFYAI